MLGLAHIPHAVPPFMSLNGFDPFTVRKARNLQLAPREIQILMLLKIGLQAKEIGDRLGISATTVHGYVKDLKSKVGAQTLIELGIWIERHLPAESEPIPSFPSQPIVE